MILVKSPSEDIFRKRPILGNRILTPIRDDFQEKLAEEHEARIKREGGRTVPVKETDIFRRRPILGNRILIPARETTPKPTPKPTPEPTTEPNPMELAMEEIRAAQSQREEQANMFEQMMGGAFRDATGRMITGLSEEARDYIGILMANGIGAEEAENIARNELGE